MVVNVTSDEEDTPTEEVYVPPEEEFIPTEQQEKDFFKKVMQVRLRLQAGNMKTINLGELNQPKMVAKNAVKKAPPKKAAP